MRATAKVEWNTLYMYGVATVGRTTLYMYGVATVGRTTLYVKGYCNGGLDYKNNGFAYMVVAELVWRSCNTVRQTNV